MTTGTAVGPRPPAVAPPFAPALAVPVVVVLGLLFLQPAPAAAQAPDDDPAALTVLRRAVVAALTVPHDADELVGAWDAGTASVRAVSVRQDASGRRWVSSRGADPHAVAPSDDGVGGEAGAATAVLWRPATTPTGTVDVLGLLANAFALTLEPHARIDERPASVVAARREGRAVARFWIDDATGLLLRQETYDGRGRLVRLAAVTDLEVGTAARTPDPGGAVTAGTAPAPAAWAHRLGESELADLRRRLCSCPAELPGGYLLVDARRSTLGGSEVTHLTYTDGLSGVSVFVQGGRLAGGVPGAQVQQWGAARVHVAGGWPLRAVWQGGESVLTAVSDAPPEQLRSIVAALPHVPAQDGLAERVGRGLRRAWEHVPGR